MVLEGRIVLIFEEGVITWEEVPGYWGLESYLVLHSGYICTDSSGCPFKTQALY